MVIHSIASRNGNSLVIAETSGSGGGKWGRPGHLSLVEIAPGTEFTSVRGKNVVRVVTRRRVDLRSRGPRSEYGLQLDAPKSLAEVTSKHAA